MAQLSNQTLLTTKHTKIFGFSQDLKLTLSQHINVTIVKTKEHLTFLNHSFLPSEDKQNSNLNNNMPQILVLRDKLYTFVANFILL